MPIRITGMNSGLDTEALVSELVSAYRAKAQKYEKAQKQKNKLYKLHKNEHTLKTQYSWGFGCNRGRNMVK